MTKTTRWMITLLALGFSCAALAEGGGAIGGGGWAIKSGAVTTQTARP
ncbi:hypothetical protein [Deinococcus altitudinis]